MRIFKSLLLYLIFISAVGCANVNKKVEVIGITYDSGDRRHHVFIGTNDKAIDSSYQHERLLKESIEEYDGIYKHTIKPEAMDYFSEYVESHCHNISEKSRKYFSEYTIRLYTREGLQKCYYNDENEILQYFTGMIEWLNKSQYQKDYKDIIDQLKLFVKLYK